MALKNLSFTKQAPSGATPEEISAAEAKLSIRFPPALIEFCTRWNGGFPSDDNVLYAVPSSFTEFHEEYKNEDGVLVHVLFGLSEKFYQCNLLRKFELLNTYSYLGVIPISSDLLGNQVVLQAQSPQGLVYWRDKDLWEIPENSGPGPHFGERPHLIPIAQDLESFYNSLTADLS